jgi:leader peptidase (prepilin peptidase) / N-methyltransferase
MIYFALIAFFIFSVIIGSFLNVVIYRYNTGLSIAKGRSKCFSCGTTLQPLDLVPVLSYVFNKGKCRHCHSSISPQYPLVELLTGVVLTSIFYMYFFSAHSGSFIGMYIFNMSEVFQVFKAHPWVHILFFIMDIKIASLLIAIGVYDIKHKIIPDGLVYTAAGIACIKMLIALLVFGNFSAFAFIISISSGLLAGLPFALLWLVSGGRWIGLGDAKLALVIGWALGVGHGFTAIIFSFWIGCIAILGIMLLRELVSAFSDKHNSLNLRLFKAKTVNRITNALPALKLKSELPFGPYMIIGLYVVYFTGKTLFKL